jgi:hypothetical protein
VGRRAIDSKVFRGLKSTPNILPMALEDSGASTAATGELDISLLLCSGDTALLILYLRAEGQKDYRASRHQKRH